jgi:hypothetical protein
MGSIGAIWDKSCKFKAYWSATHQHGTIQFGLDLDNIKNSSSAAKNKMLDESAHARS